MAMMVAVLGLAPAQAEQLVKEKTALVFIEFQEEWIGTEARLGKLLYKDQDALKTATRNAAAVLAAARAHGWSVAHTPLQLASDPDYALFGKGAMKFGLRGAIPKAKTWHEAGSKFVAPFIPQRGEFVAQGRSGASVITNSTLDPFLRNNGIDTIVLMGFATHVCVESTLRQAHDLGYNVYVVTDGVAAFEPEQQRHFETHVLHHFGEGITADALIRVMGTSPKP